MSYFNRLETVEQVDEALSYKSYQLSEAIIPAQRSIVNEQIDDLLDLRILFGKVALDGTFDFMVPGTEQPTD